MLRNIKIPTPPLGLPGGWRGMGPGEAPGAERRSRQAARRQSARCLAVRQSRQSSR